MVPCHREDFLAELRELNADGTCSIGNERGLRHARYCIDFDGVRLARITQHDIEARDSRAAARSKRTHGEILYRRVQSSDISAGTICADAPGVYLLS